MTIRISHIGEISKSRKRIIKNDWGIVTELIIVLISRDLSNWYPQPQYSVA